ncbi:MAG: hypothetical protein NW216_06045 [Hyphomicrobium sp.]|nr:hypothetical protein [Hyphomicrobium sp.]
MIRMLPKVFAVSSIVAILSSDPGAADFLTSKEKATGKVTACSWQNEDRCYTAKIEKGRFGPQMRLNGGTVLDCAGDCRDTLRRATVDFWDDQRERSRD